MYCILAISIKTSFGDIVYFEPMNVQYKKLVNGIINQMKVSLIDGDGNEILSNFKISIVFAYRLIFSKVYYISWK